jgi:hypothetical protein
MLCYTAASIGQQQMAHHMFIPDDRVLSTSISTTGTGGAACQAGSRLLLVLPATCWLACLVAAATVAAPCQACLGLSHTHHHRPLKLM